MILEANRHYWNKDRGPRLERVIFRNDLSAEEALHWCISTEGLVDMVTSVLPADAGRVKASPYADLVAVNADQVLAGIFNRFVKDIAFGDIRLREAINLSVDREKLVRQGFYGYASRYLH